jgi:hypothetical protein
MSKNTIQWETPGKLLDVDSSGKLSPLPNPIKDGKVEITEAGNSFYFNEFQDAPIAGIPIDANLAIYLIKRLSDKLSLIQKTLPANGEDEQWLLDLLINSLSISIDKNGLLKTLSQPGCEGIRFYLCTKLEKDDDEPDNFSDILSLVTVGIDKDGKDLGYDFNQASANEIADNIFKVETESLTTEYSYPPPPRKKKKKTFTKLAAQTSYILGGYSWGDNIS